MTKEFITKAQETIASVLQSAQAAGDPQVMSIRLLGAPLEQREGIATALVDAVDADQGAAGTRTRNVLITLPSTSGASASQAQTTRTLLDVVNQVHSLVDKGGDTCASIEHLLITFAASKDEAERIPSNAGTTPEVFNGAFVRLRPEAIASADPKGSFEALKRYGRDLTEVAREGKLDPVINRDIEIRRVVQVPSRRTKNNPVLIGEPDVGRTAIVEGLAQRIVAGDVPESLRDKILIVLDLPAMVAGAEYRGEFEERLKAVLVEIQRFDEQIVTFVDEFHTVAGAGAGSGGAMNAGNMLKPMLAQGKLRMVSATIFDEHRENVEKDPALGRRFQQVLVDESSVEDTVAVLRGIVPKYETHHRATIFDGALVAVASLSDRYVTGRQPPGRAADLIDEVASRLHMELDSSPVEIDELRRTVGRLHIEEFYPEESDPKHVDESTQERLDKLRVDFADEQETLTALTGRWEAEKVGRDRVGGLHVQLDELRTQLELAIYENRWEEAGRLQDSEIPAIEHQVSEAEAAPEQVDTDSAEPMVVEKVGPTEIAEVVESWTGIPTDRLPRTKVGKLLRMEEEIGKRLIGQRKAVQAVSDVVRRSCAGVADPNRPTGFSLFPGSTGVDKTELVKILAEFLFDDERAMVRIDMSEHSEKHSVVRLVGVPPECIGYEQDGQPMEAVRRRPYCAIPLGEVERMDPEVFDVLLQVLDDGRLTNGQECTAGFRNTILALISDLGSQPLADQTINEKERRGAVMEAVYHSFKPELLNRPDKTITFDLLPADDLSGIVDLMIAGLARHLEDRRVGLLVSKPAHGWLTRIGYNPAYGACPLRRAIQKEIGDRLAKMLLAGEIADGRTVRVDVSGELDSPCMRAFRSAETAEQTALGGAKEEYLG